MLADEMHQPNPPSHPPSMMIKPSPLMLSDHLLTLAEEAARAGLKRPAGTLLRLALQVLDQAPRT